MRPTRLDGGGRGDDGQAAAELALVLPVIALVLLAGVQVALVLRDHLLVTHAAREAARQLAVDPNVGRAREAAARNSGLKFERLAVETSYIGGSVSMVTATVTYQAATVVPLVGPLVPDVELRAKAAMRNETGHTVARTAVSVKNQQEPRHDPTNRPSVPNTGPARID